MQQFIDEVTVTASSGHGGAGKISFRREKYVPKGGPDGGDGGRGGNLIVGVRSDLRTLFHLTRTRVIQARDGERGGKRDRHGADGKDAVIEVPPGSVIVDCDSGEVLVDAVEDGTRFELLHGGRGGKGNAHFATSRNQTPRFAQDGEEGAELHLRIELRLIADIGFVGKPNAGKSSLLGRLTAAHPKVGNYPFTTKIPSLGVLQIDDDHVVLADIPGLIEGAAEGVGLGDQFLKHISRTRYLAFVIDLSEEEPAAAVRVLEEELSAYSTGLAAKPRMLVGNKIDLPGTEEGIRKLTTAFPGETVFGVSALTGIGIRPLAGAFLAAGHAAEPHSTNE
ncbi:MAG: GTPase ObgE [Spirochaetia bacterium]